MRERNLKTQRQFLGERPKVGVAVMVIRGGKVLMGKRKGAHGEGGWAFPGGNLEFGERLETCARREVFEETGLRVENVRKAACTNDIFVKEGKHYLTVFFLADHKAGEPRVREPEKCEGWEWRSWNRLPQPLFLPIRNLLREGYNPFR